MKHTIFN